MKRVVLVVALSGCSNILGIGEPSLGTDAAPDPPPDAGCVEDTVQDCFDGPIELRDVGACVLGQQTCSEAGTWGPCVGEGAPNVEVCDLTSQTVDENCDAIAECTGAYARSFPTTGGKFLQVGVDAQSAIYTLGSYEVPYTIDGNVLPGGMNGEISLIKQLPTGEVVWAKGIASLGIQIPQGMRVASDGTTTITGLYTADAGEQFMIGTRRLTAFNVGDAQTFVARFDPEGNAVWASTMETDTSHEYAATDRAHLTLGADGSTYLLQASQTSQFTYFRGPVTAENTVTLAPQGTLRVVHLDDGGHLIDYRSLAFPDGDIEARGIARGASDSTYIGVVNHGAPVVLSGTATVPTGGSILKLGPPPTFTPELVIALAGQPTQLVEGPGDTVFIAGEAPAFVTQLRANDTLGWSVSTPDASASAITVDPAGNVVVVGSCMGLADLDPSSPAGTLLAGDGACVAKYSRTGTFVWGSPMAYANTITSGVAASPFGSVVIAGDYTPFANLGAGAIDATGGFVLELRP